MSATDTPVSALIRNERLAVHVEPFGIGTPTWPSPVASMTAHRGGCGFPGKNNAANKGLKPILTA
jgi:hypothetical protein